MEIIIILLIVLVLSYEVVNFNQLKILTKLIKKHFRKLHLVFYELTNDSLTTNNGVITMIELTKTQKVEIQVKAFDNSEPPKEAPLENIVFVSSDEAVCTVVQDPTDPSKATVFAHEDGVARIDVSADGNLGEGELPLSGFLGIEVQTVFGANLGFEVGEAQEQ